uniref:NR LBD domain-containing protein n=1 Tax=Parastrongyloides trichosuri TaxID=131310 RepID=A0A0N4ZQH7_PARTI
MDKCHNEKKDLIKELKEKMEKFNLHRKYSNYMGRGHYTNSDKPIGSNSYPRIRYIYAFPEEIEKRYIDIIDKKNKNNHSIEVIEKEEINYEEYRLKGNKYPTSCPEINMAVLEKATSPRSVNKPININLSSPFSSDKSTYLASNFNNNDTEVISYRNGSTLIDIGIEPYLKVLEDALSHYFPNINNVKLEEIKSKNDNYNNDMSEHLWEKILCFSDNNKKILVKIENRMLINMNESDLNFINCNSSKPIVIETIKYIYEKIDKKISLEWIDLYVIKTWNYSIILPLERKYFNLLTNNEKEIIGEELNEKYCIYEELLHRIIIKNNDILAYKAYIIMLGEAYKFHQRILSDNSMKSLYLEKSIKYHKELLNILKDDLNNDPGNIWRALRYSMSLLRESKSNDNEFIKLLQHFINYFIDDKIFGKLCLCDQKKVLKYQQYIANLDL